MNDEVLKDLFSGDVDTYKVLEQVLHQVLQAQATDEPPVLRKVEWL